MVFYAIFPGMSVLSLVAGLILGNKRGCIKLAENTPIFSVGLRWSGRIEGSLRPIARVHGKRLEVYNVHVEKHNRKLVAFQ